MALAVVVSGLMALGAAAPASALVIACSASVDANDGELPPRPRGTERVTSAVLRINLPSPEYPAFGSRSLLMRAGPQEEIARLEPQAPEGEHTFSTQGGLSGVASQPGDTYYSSGLGSIFNFYASGAPVLFEEQSQSAGFRPIQGYWRLDLTFSDCDTDEDGALDNACDSTPFPPAPPAGTTTGSTTTLPPGATTGPVVAQPVAAALAVTLRYAKRKRVFRGVVASAAGSCAAYAEASLWRKKPGADRRLVISTTDEAGKFRTPKVRRPGKYFATVEANPDGPCAGARSPLVRLRRR